MSSTPYREAVAAVQHATSTKAVCPGAAALFRIHLDLAAANAGRSFATRGWLAEQMGVTVRTVDHWHRQLEEAGLLVRAAVFDDWSGWQTANSYYVATYRKPPVCAKPKRTVSFERHHDRLARSRGVKPASPRGRGFVSPPVSNRPWVDGKRDARGPRSGAGPVPIGRFVRNMTNEEVQGVPPETDVHVPPRLEPDLIERNVANIRSIRAALAR
jgi:hypothetical protein